MYLRCRKGQAAAEFFLTYGWAIIFVLSVIGCLAYFGVLDPERFTDRREECAMSIYNIYSNSTEARYHDGRCYVEEYYWEETRVVCHETLFSISCYESDTSRKELKSRVVCFYLETGERC